MNSDLAVLGERDRHPVVGNDRGGHPTRPVVASVDGHFRGHLELARLRVRSAEQAQGTRQSDPHVLRPVGVVGGLRDDLLSRLGATQELLGSLDRVALELDRHDEVATLEVNRLAITWIGPPAISRSVSVIRSLMSVASIWFASLGMLVSVLRCTEGGLSISMFRDIEVENSPSEHPRNAESPPTRRSRGLALVDRSHERALTYGSSFRSPSRVSEHVDVSGSPSCHRRRLALVEFSDLVTASMCAGLRQRRCRSQR